VQVEFFVRASIAVHKELLEGPEGRLKDMFSTRCMESVGGASLHSQCREIGCVAQHACHKWHKQVAEDGKTWLRMGRTDHVNGTLQQHDGGPPCGAPET
jgi:hypothetical protein